MSKLGLLIRVVGNIPLHTLSSNKASACSKAISILAITILTCLSLGLYTICVYKFFSDKKVIDLKDKLFETISSGILVKLEDIFNRHPKALKKMVVDCGQDFLKQALDGGEEEIVDCLIKKGVELPIDILTHYFSNKNSKLAIKILLVDKFQGNIDSAQNLFSLLGLMASGNQGNFEEDKKLMMLLIKKGDRLTEGDKRLVPKEVQEFINEEVNKLN